jgi:hypothetical protein
MKTLFLATLLLTTAGIAHAQTEAEFNAAHPIPTATCRVSMAAYLGNVPLHMGQVPPRTCQFVLNDYIVIQKIKEVDSKEGNSYLYLVTQDPKWVGDIDLDQPELQGTQPALMFSSTYYPPDQDLSGVHAYVLGPHTYQGQDGYDHQVYALADVTPR